MSTDDSPDFRPRRRQRPSDSSSEPPSDSRPTGALWAHDSSAAAFHTRLQSGGYRELFGEQLGEVMAQAAAAEGVNEELGALRIVMARLLTEEEDPVVLAPMIARIAAVSIQAARAQRAISGKLAESLTDAITLILTDLDGRDE